MNDNDEGIFNENMKLTIRNRYSGKHIVSYYDSMFASIESINFRIEIEHLS